MDDASLEELVVELLSRVDERRDGEPVTNRWPDLDLAAAYRAQDLMLRRLTDRGERLTGVKLGLTSQAKQERMGISSPLTAWLTDAMSVPLGSPIEVDSLIHPRVEPEIVFVMGERLAGPGVTAEQALASVDRVYAGLEVIDSRFTDFKFTLPDVVADNASSSRYVVGLDAVSPRDLDLAAELCVLSRDGVEVARATGSAVQGHPAEALALAANDLGARGLAIEAGQLVLTGGLTDAIDLARGQTVSASFANLGTVTVTAR